ncbi:MAG: hypothetical protein U9R17_17995 [Thermodesulfobacteriota bacterium]|nr:hypothetical protein [Thermodesulfobacteriota bacterium]
MSVKKNTFSKATGILLAVIFTFSLFGMGSFDEGITNKIPEPDDNFSAKIIDQNDVSSDITSFSHDGLTFVSGKRGGGFISIPFTNIQCMNFFKKDGNQFATVIMKKEAEVELKMDDDGIFYGRLSYGLFSIKIGEVKKIIINGKAGQGK